MIQLYFNTFKKLAGEFKSSSTVHVCAKFHYLVEFPRYKNTKKCMRCIKHVISAVVEKHFLNKLQFLFNIESDSLKFCRFAFETVVIACELYIY